MKARHTAILLLLVLACCGASQREKTLNAAAVTLKAATAAYEVLDTHRLAELVAASVTSEEKRELLRQYQIKRAPVVLAFELAYQAMGLAIVLNGNDAALTKAVAAALAAKQAYDAWRKADL